MRCLSLFLFSGRRCSPQNLCCLPLKAFQVWSFLRWQHYGLAWRHVAVKYYAQVYPLLLHRPAPEREQFRWPRVIFVEKQRMRELRNYYQPMQKSVPIDG